MRYVWEERHVETLEANPAYHFGAASVKPGHLNAIEVFPEP
jgi:hypothetical protein